MPRLAARSDFPTPPLPPPIAMMRRWPVRSGTLAGCRISSGDSTALQRSRAAALTRLSGALQRSGKPDTPRLVFVDQLGIPIARVDEAEEGNPLLVGDLAAGRAEGGVPLGAARCSQQAHPGLVGELGALLQIARKAAADHVFPGGAASPRA